MNKTKTLKILTIVLSAVIFVSAVILLYEFIRIANLKSTQKKLQSNLDATTNAVYEYSDKNAYYADRANFLEEYAREVYGWGKTDRTYFEE